MLAGVFMLMLQQTYPPAPPHFRYQINFSEKEWNIILPSGTLFPHPQHPPAGLHDSLSWHVTCTANTGPPKEVEGEDEDRGGAERGGEEGEDEVKEEPPKGGTVQGTRGGEGMDGAAEVCALPKTKDLEVGWEAELVEEAPNEESSGWTDLSSSDEEGCDERGGKDEDGDVAATTDTDGDVSNNDGASSSGGDSGGLEEGGVALTASPRDHLDK